MTSTPESIDAFAERVYAAQERGGGRLDIDREGMAGWSTFPFEAAELQARPISPLADTEGSRLGDDPATCPLGGCPAERSDHEVVIWTDGRWQLKVPPPSGVPLILILEPLAHHDLVDLPDDLAGDMGRLSVLVTRLMEELPSVGRTHLMRIGDGATHLHLWFVARPARMPNLRGSFNVVWDDVLPPIPVEVRDANASFVVERLAQAYGGHAVG